MQRDLAPPITAVEFRKIRAQRLAAFSASFETQIAENMRLGIREFELVYAEEGQLKYSELSEVEKRHVIWKAREIFSTGNVVMMIDVSSYKDTVKLEVAEGCCEECCLLYC